MPTSEEKKSGRIQLRAAKEAGAVAVEFALVVPVFILLVFGIFEFGRAFNIQVSLSQAGRESARYAAVHYLDASYNVNEAKAAGVAAAPSLPITASNVEISFKKSADGSTAPSCGTGVNVVSTVRYPTGFLTGLEKLIGVTQPFTVTGVGVMRCGA